jgi:ABC-type uncharacterized transport system fused permease/ATPase subunit
VFTSNLNDLLTYPNFCILKDNEISNLLESVKLSHLLSKNDQIIDWNNILSPGEKQRISFARLFYNNPKFAILDEATSSLDIDVEEFLYNNCIYHNITLLSISHRNTLFKFHQNLIFLNGDGSWKFEILNDKIQN